VFVTANGTQLGTFTKSSAWQDGGIQNNLRVPPGPTTSTSFTSPGSVTVTDSLGGSATIPVTLNPKYSLAQDRFRRRRDGPHWTSGRDAQSAGHGQVRGKTLHPVATSVTEVKHLRRGGTAHAVTYRLTHR
jgi:hypothetical protein